MPEPLEVVSTNADVEVRAVEVAPVNREDVVGRINAVGNVLREIIVEVKRLPRDKTLAPHQDELRCLAQAQTNLQTGLMWLRRAVEQSKVF